MGKDKCPECETCLPAWLAAFGDLMSLLLCFFVLLLSMSSMDAKKVSEAIGSLAGAMSVLEGGTKTEISKQRIQESIPIDSNDETSEQVNRVKQAVSDANEMMKKGQGPAVSIEESQDGFVIELPASLLFKEGSAKIENEDALLFLKRMALIVDTLPNTVDVSVQGHADSAKLGPDSPYKDDWEISVARALSVLHELILDGVDPKRISAAGFGQYRPVASNATKEGRAKNRRVELHFYGTATDEQSNVQKSILEKSSAK